MGDASRPDNMETVSQGWGLVRILDLVPSVVGAPDF
jgi:hypothetical protein